MQKSSKSRQRFCVLAGSVIAASSVAAQANITGFSGFAAVNNPGSVAGVGYSLDGSSFQVTTASNSEAVSGWYPTAQDITNFTASFTYTSVPGYNSGGSTLAADGFSFNFQSPTGLTTAIGGNGGSRGYTGIPNPSAAVGFDTFGGYYNYGGAVATATNGSYGSFSGFNNGVNLSYGTPENVTLKYSNGNMVVSLYDPSTHAAFVQSYTGVNLPSVIGSTTALIGVSGGTGGYNSAQSVTNFSYKTTALLTAGNHYNPIATTGGFNAGVIVPLSAATNTPSTPFTSLTASLDGGTSKSGFTFYEKGYNSAAPTTGVPTSGGTFVSASDPNHTFQMQTYGVGSDALLLNSSNLSGTFTLATPAAYNGLSFLTSDGGGSGEFAVTLNFANGSSETDDGNVSSDWFSAGQVAVSASGRVNSTNGYNAVGTANPSLYQVDVNPTDTTDLIKSITVTYDNNTSDTTNFAVFAISGAVPEPASLSLIGVAAFGLLRRRSRTMA